MFDCVSSLNGSVVVFLLCVVFFLFHFVTVVWGRDASCVDVMMHITAAPGKPLGGVGGFKPDWT